MKFDKYLINEKFWDAYKNSPSSNDVIEIFVNPSRRELREIGDGDGVRGVVDFNSKKVYVWTYMVTHVAMFGNTDYAKKMGITDLREMWLDGDGLLDAITFTLAPLNSKQTESDLLDFISRHGNEMQLKNLNKVLERDFKWMNKYEGLGDKLKRQIEDTVTKLDKVI